jgi:hypothetical protein
VESPSRKTVGTATGSIVIAVIPGFAPSISSVSLSSQLKEPCSRAFSRTADPPGALSGGGVSRASRTLTMKLRVTECPAGTPTASSIKRRDSALIVVSETTLGRPSVTDTR